MADLRKARRWCRRCDWKWMMRTNREPKLCPHCHSPVWHTKRTGPKTGGRPRSQGKRCPCGQMTLKRAIARGHVKKCRGDV